VGLAIATAGLLYLTRLPVHGHYVPDLLAGLLPLAIGLGLVFVPITLLGTSGVSNDDAGLASGLFNSAQQIGGSLGLAILATLSVSHANSLIKHGAAASAANRVAATVSGYHVAFLVAAIMIAAGGAILVVFLRRRHVEGLELDPSAMTMAA
jgi:hypothetical protein